MAYPDTDFVPGLSFKEQGIKGVDLGTHFRRPFHGDVVIPLQSTSLVFLAERIKLDDRHIDGGQFKVNHACVGVLRVRNGGVEVKNTFGTGGEVDGG